MTKKPSRYVKDRYFGRFSYFSIIGIIIYFHILSFLPRQFTNTMVGTLKFLNRRGMRWHPR